MRYGRGVNGRPPTAACKGACVYKKACLRSVFHIAICGIFVPVCHRCQRADRAGGIHVGLIFYQLFYQVYGNHLIVTKMFLLYRRRREKLKNDFLGNQLQDRPSSPCAKTILILVKSKGAYLLKLKAGNYAPAQYLSNPQNRQPELPSDSNGKNTYFLISPNNWIIFSPRLPTTTPQSPALTGRCRQRRQSATTPAGARASRG